jgi:hypothetical protein
MRGLPKQRFAAGLAVSQAANHAVAGHDVSVSAPAKSRNSAHAAGADPYRRQSTGYMQRACHKNAPKGPVQRIRRMTSINQSAVSESPPSPVQLLCMPTTSWTCLRGAHRAMETGGAEPAKRDIHVTLLRRAMWTPRDPTRPPH